MPGMARSGEAGSVLVPRRHAPPDSFLHAPNNKVTESEPKRKSWGERWRLGRSTKTEEASMDVQPHYMVHPDYVTKYGTISPGVLTKSVKYAETWLYGTVGVRAPQHRPSLFLYPGVVPSPPRTLDHRPVFPRFVNGPISNLPQRTAKSGCQCPGSRNGPNCRLCSVRKQSKTRPSLLQSTPQDDPTVHVVSSDPYNLMRKSRLGMGEMTETSIINPKTLQKRNRSCSPNNRLESIPSFETFKPRNEQIWTGDSGSWECDEEEELRPKSILECNVSAYDLNNKDDSSEDLSDGTLEINTKLKILRPKLCKTDLKQRKIQIPEPKKLPNETELRLSGQRLRMFPHKSASKTVERVEKEGSNIECVKPKRPPRKLKQNGFKLSKLRSTSSPNLSIKSILKKPNCEDTSDSSISEGSPPSSAECGKVFDLNHKKVSQSTLKKKKQVQFNVTSGSSENLGPLPENILINSEHTPTLPTSKVTEEMVIDSAEPEVIRRSASCSDLLEDDTVLAEDSMTVQTTECDEANHPKDEDVVIVLPVGSTLRRSLSDRRPIATVVKYKDEIVQVSTSPPNSYLFNDTMALRPRSVRLDTREVFLDRLSDEFKGKGRPKDPPPPPPPAEKSPVTKNLMSYAEFSRLVDEANEKEVDGALPPPDPPPRHGPPSRNRSEPHRVCVENLQPPPIKLCDNCEHGLTRPNDDGKTIVTITHSEEKELPKRTSIIINGSETNSERSSRKTSVIIKNFQVEDCNKVTISVRNSVEESQSCSTIIDMGSQSAVIPVVSSDNKTTLVVGTPVCPPSENPPLLAQAPAPYIFSSTTLLDNMDPVEAVKRNLVPHVCGKEDPPIPLIERLSGEKEIKGTPLLQLSKLFSNKGTKDQPSPQAMESLLLAYQARKVSQWKKTEDSSTPTSRSSSFCGSLKTSSRNTSRSNSFNEYNSLPHDKSYAPSDSDETITQELDKLDDEYVIRNHLPVDRKDEENIYETIQEPIYDLVGCKLKEEDESDLDDTPPPLPTSLPPSLEDLENRASKSIFEGASKYDILSYLVDAKDRVQEDAYLIEHRRMESLDGSELSAGGKSTDSGIDTGPPSNSSDSSEDRDSLLLTRKPSAEVERNDSGVGSETSQSSRSKWQGNSVTSREDPLHLCEDCDLPVETQVTDCGVMYAPLICRKCAKKRSERKEIIQEIVETEEKYGRDLRIILEEFYRPMLVAGLLTPDQLSTIFLNVEELLENSETLTEKLKDTLEIAVEQGDEDLLTVNVGRLFLDAKPMLPTFESYCTRQATAAVLLASLEKDKELLRIFLRVSQMENAVLRRMNLNSFLMVPVQRVTKYPLLLARLYKVTPSHHDSRELLKEAQHNIELHLEHMNAEAKDAATTRVWRRFSTTTNRKSTAEMEMTSIKLRKMAVDLLEWSHDEVRFVMEGRLLFAQPTDGNWKRGRTVKLTPIFVLLATLGKPNAKYRADSLTHELTFPAKTGVREATLLLIKEKCGRFTLIREPLYLDKLIVCCESDCEEYLEVQELITKETFIFKGEDTERTKEWYRQLQYHAQILGGWRKRRNALANIMITGMSYGA